MDQPELRAAWANALVAVMHERRHRGLAVPDEVAKILDAIAETYGPVPVQSRGTGITRGGG